MRGNHGAAAAAASAAAQKHGRQTAISMKRKKEKSLVYLQASRDGARKLIREDVEEVSERSERALRQDEHTRDESRDMATVIIAISKLLN